VSPEIQSRQVAAPGWRSAKPVRFCPRGRRRGDAAGLRWCDLDLDAGSAAATRCDSTGIPAEPRVGFQARDRAHPDRERPDQVIADAALLVNPTGAVGIAGVYPERDLHPQPRRDRRRPLTVPWGTFFSKGATVRFGRTHDRRYTTHLRDLITSGRARPGRIVTHQARVTSSACAAGSPACPLPVPLSSGEARRPRGAQRRRSEPSFNDSACDRPRLNPKPLTGGPGG
jgi:hypothetical protein